MSRFFAALAGTLLFALSSMPSHAWSIYFGEKETPTSRDNIYLGGLSSGLATFNAGMPTVAVHSETSMRKVGTSSYYWDGFQSGGTGGGVYCNSHHDMHDIRMSTSYQSSGQRFDGHTLWKTSVSGLYFSVKFTTLNFGTGITGPVWLDSNTINLDFSGFIPPENLRACGGVENKFMIMGGIVLTAEYHFYADSSFRPTASPLSMNFTKVQQDYDFLFEMTDPRADLYGSKQVKFNITGNPMVVTFPTCTARSISGSSVTGTTVALGEHKASDIRNGLAAVPFSLNLEGCSYVKNVQVKLVSSSVGTGDTTLLTNTKTGADAAKGVGVMIEGDANPLSAKMTLVPNKADSIYHFSSYANQSDYQQSSVGNALQTLKFFATLKQDGSATIGSGRLEAKGTFQITYP
ncbi:putative fimbrial-like adhesin protein [Leminorella richardii]|uniref:Putative fimbrial-like adhesin protein n=1 Tax=Leminorella richardii TaxID=158841 RepID=A0A2X4V433_9GAMM|nr:fimbrial protein [Leminorella richardii]SQI42958.1 putative fimbrial-like adhesin protein [Leminorella richardii]